MAEIISSQWIGCLGKIEAGNPWDFDHPNLRLSNFPMIQWIGLVGKIEAGTGPIYFMERSVWFPKNEFPCRSIESSHSE